MARNENPPFARGETYYNGETIDTNNLGGLNLEGAEWVFEDDHASTGVARTRGRPVRCRCVRNSSGINLLPKRLAKFELGALEFGSRCDGYAIQTAANTPEQGYPIDEYLPTAGVPTNDLFWIVIEGPATVLTSIADMATDLAIGEWAVACTAATSQATTAGRIVPQIATGLTVPGFYNQLNKVGRALSGAITTTTAAAVVLDVGKW